MQQRSTVEWAPTSVCTDPVAMANLHRAVSKLVMRKGIAERVGNMSFEMLHAEWGDAVDVKSAFFYYTAEPERLMYPKYPPTVARWKALIHDYCEWHEITRLDQIVSLWSDITDAFMSCPDYDQKVNSDFRAWAYGCMCKFVLEQRKQNRIHANKTGSSLVYDTTVPYSPEHPGY